MNQRDLVLACMAAAGVGSYQPVQIQKLVFLFENKALHENIFNFIPFDYGPFDPDVYKRLEELTEEGIVEIIGQPFDRERKYKLTPAGKDIAKTTLQGLPEETRDYLYLLSEWVRRISFAQLIGAIYREYPQMRQNSVFEG
jgi:uncharacterized protein